jgi:hypothetical protein
VWGVRAIAEEIGLTPASVYYKLAAGHIVSARKCGKEWVANREDLRREFSVARGGAAINQTPSQTHRLLATGRIKCARRIGRRWMADADELDREFSTPDGVRAIGEAWRPK